MKIWVTGETDLIGQAIFNGKNTLVDIQSAICCICSGQAETMLTKAMEIRESYPDKQIVLVIPGRVPINVIREAKLRDIRICSPGKILDELPPEPEEDQGMMPIITANTLPVLAQKRGKVVASFSTSGEVGKTFTSTNLGVLAANEKKKVILLEFDLGKGNDLEVLGIHPEGDYPDVMTWRDYGENWHSNALRHSTGLYLLPRSEDTLEMLMSSQEAMELIEEARRHFDLVIVDMDRNPFEEHLKAALIMADHIFLLTRVNEKGLNHSKAFLTNAARVLNLNHKIHLIPNRINQYSEYSPEKLAELLGISDHTKIPEDLKSVEEAKKKNKLVVLYGKGPAAAALKEIYNKFLAEKKEKPRENIFQKLLSLLPLGFLRRNKVV